MASKIEGAQELAVMRGSQNGQRQFFAAIWQKMVTPPRTAVILEACQREYRACESLAFWQTDGLLIARFIREKQKRPGLARAFENLRWTRCQDRDEGGDDVYQHPGTNGRTIAEIKRAKTAVPGASSARKPGSSAEKHDILLLNTLSRPFSYSD